MSSPGHRQRISFCRGCVCSMLIGVAAAVGFVVDYPENPLEICSGMACDGAEGMREIIRIMTGN